MSSQTLSIEVPDLLVELLGTPEAVANGMRRALVLDLLRQARISQGRAAELLGITRWDLIDLMAEHDVPMGPASPEEMREEIATVRQLRDENATARAARLTS